jgi:hypothetical protein
VRKLFLIILFLISILELNAQFYQGLYTFKNLPLNRLYNPSADIRYEKEILPPLISHIQVQGQLYGTSLSEIFSPQSANATIESFITNKNGNEHTWLSEKMNILYFGFRDNTVTNYWSFGIYQELQSFGFYPADYVDFAYNGNANNIGGSYDISHFRGQLNAMTVYHAGLTYKPPKEKYTLGGRIKIYNSFATIDASHNNGSITTQLNTQSNKANILIDGQLNLKTSGLAAFSSKSQSQIGTNFIVSGNMGLGFDLGATYHFNKHWSTSASIIDVGAIYSSFDVKKYSATGKHNFEGAIIVDPNKNAEDFWVEMIEKFNEDIVYGESTKGFIATLPPKIFASVSYSVTGMSYTSNNSVTNCSNRTKKYIDTDHTFSFTSYNKVLGNYWDWALGVSYLGELNSWLAIQGNYLYSPYDTTNFGAGISARFGWVLFYVSADNIPGLLNLNEAHSAGAMAGINIVWEGR